MASAYQPTIPTGNVPLNEDYVNLQNNFQQLDTTFGVDHTLVSNQTAVNGFHTVIHIIANGSVPSPGSGIGELYTQIVNDGINIDTPMYWQTGGGINIAMTRNFAPTVAQNGATFLPGGLILNWGRADVNASGSTTTINFTQQYASSGSVYSITIGCINSDSSASPASNNVYIRSGSVAKDKFVVMNTSSSSILKRIYWMAIGS